MASMLAALAQPRYYRDTIVILSKGVIAEARRLEGEQGAPGGFRADGRVCQEEVETHRP